MKNNLKLIVVLLLFLGSNCFIGYCERVCSVTDANDCFVFNEPEIYDYASDPVAIQERKEVDKKAQNLVKAGNFEEAIKIHNQLLASTLMFSMADVAEQRLQILNIHALQGRLGLCLAEIEWLLEKFPSKFEYHFEKSLLKARLNFEESKTAESYRGLQIKAESKAIRYIAQVIALYEYVGDYEQGIALAREYQQRVPNKAWYYQDLINTLEYSQKSGGKDHLLHYLHREVLPGNLKSAKLR